MRRPLSSCVRRCGNDGAALASAMARQTSASRGTDRDVQTVTPSEVEGKQRCGDLVGRLHPAWCTSHRVLVASHHRLFRPRAQTRGVAGVGILRAGRTVLSSCHRRHRLCGRTCVDAATHALLAHTELSTSRWRLSWPPLRCGSAAQLPGDGGVSATCCCLRHRMVLVAADFGGRMSMA